MSQPASKLDAYAFLHDWSRTVNDLDLRRALVDLEKLKTQVTGGQRAHTYTLLGAVYKRMGRKEDALACLRAAMMLAPTAKTKCNFAAALSDLGRIEDALEVLGAAADDDDRSLIILSNLASALMAAGSAHHAREVYQHAATVANFGNKDDLFFLAGMAAMVEADAEAVELFARFLARDRGESLGDAPALQYVHACLDDPRCSYIEVPVAVQLSMRRQAVLLAPQDAPGSDAELDEATLAEHDRIEAETYEWTRPLRAEANADANAEHLGARRG
jgi:tetratricopeptide (TPR) repeat protein